MDVDGESAGANKAVEPETYDLVDEDEPMEEDHRQVIRESTVEDALATRGIYDQLHHQSTASKQQRKGNRQGQDSGVGNSSDEKAGEQLNRESLLDESESIVLNPAASLHFLNDEDDYKLSLLRDKLVDVSRLGVNEQRELEMKWALLTDSVSLLAAELTENLRAILEPSIASRLQGDYRSGKRLNMRRLIPYIASDYRKDRIWMRRTRRERRNYEICIAVDDSASMRDVFTTEVTCQSLCLIERALRQLEVGRLSICKFGEDVKVLTDFSSNEPTALGPLLLSELSFQQQRTNLPHMLQVMDQHFREARDVASTAGSPHQMLIILGDGRGALTDGLESVQKALARLNRAEVTTLYIVMDNGKQSIVDVRVVEFVAGGAEPRIVPYMGRFPFPFYAVVRGVGSLPTTMSEAIRQWFELINSD